MKKLLFVLSMIAVLSFSCQTEKESPEPVKDVISEKYASEASDISLSATKRNTLKICDFSPNQLYDPQVVPERFQSAISTFSRQYPDEQVYIGAGDRYPLDVLEEPDNLQQGGLYVELCGFFWNSWVMELYGFIIMGKSANVDNFLGILTGTLLYDNIQLEVSIDYQYD